MHPAKAVHIWTLCSSLYCSTDHLPLLPLLLSHYHPAFTTLTHELARARTYTRTRDTEPSERTRLTPVWLDWCFHSLSPLPFHLAPLLSLSFSGQSWRSISWRSLAWSPEKRMRGKGQQQGSWSLTPIDLWRPSVQTEGRSPGCLFHIQLTCHVQGWLSGLDTELTFYPDRICAKELHQYVNWLYFFEE